MALFKSFDSWTERELNIKAEFVHAACWDRLSVTEFVLFSAVGIDDPERRPGREAGGYSALKDSL